MSSKRAMKQAQKQAYAKHKSNITSSRYGTKKKIFIKTVLNNEEGISKISTCGKMEKFDNES